MLESLVISLISWWLVLVFCVCYAVGHQLPECEIVVFDMFGDDGSTDPLVNSRKAGFLAAGLLLPMILPDTGFEVTYVDINGTAQDALISTLFMYDPSYLHLNNMTDTAYPMDFLRFEHDDTAQYEDHRVVICPHDPVLCMATSLGATMFDYAVLSSNPMTALGATEFPNTIRVVRDNYWQAMALLGLCSRYNWNRVAIITQDTQYSLDLVKAMDDIYDDDVFPEIDLYYADFLEPDSTDVELKNEQNAAVLEAIQDLKINIIIHVGDNFDEVRRTLSVGRSMEMLTQDYMWLVTSEIVDAYEVQVGTHNDWHNYTSLFDGILGTSSVGPGDTGITDLLDLYWEQASDVHKMGLSTLDHNAILAFDQAFIAHQSCRNRDELHQYCKHMATEASANFTFSEHFRATYSCEVTCDEGQRLLDSVRCTKGHASAGHFLFEDTHNSGARGYQYYNLFATATEAGPTPIHVGSYTDANFTVSMHNSIKFSAAGSASAPYGGPLIVSYVYVIPIFYFEVILACSMCLLVIAMTLIYAKKPTSSHINDAAKVLRKLDLLTALGMALSIIGAPYFMFVQHTLSKATMKLWCDADKVIMFTGMSVLLSALFAKPYLLMAEVAFKTRVRRAYTHIASAVFIMFVLTVSKAILSPSIVTKRFLSTDETVYYNRCQSLDEQTFLVAVYLVVFGLCGHGYYLTKKVDPAQLKNLKLSENFVRLSRYGSIGTFIYFILSAILASAFFELETMVVNLLILFYMWVCFICWLVAAPQWLWAYCRGGNENVDELDAQGLELRESSFHAEGKDTSKKAFNIPDILRLEISDMENWTREQLAETLLHTRDVVRGMIEHRNRKARSKRTPVREQTGSFNQYDQIPDFVDRDAEVRQVLAKLQADKEQIRRKEKSMLNDDLYDIPVVLHRDDSANSDSSHNV